MNKISQFLASKNDDFSIEKSRELFKTIKPHSIVTIRSYHGSNQKGRVVMKGPHGWVLNLGGQHGTPGIATEENIVSVKP